MIERVINMYDIHKIIIMGKFAPEDRQNIEAVVMETYGMRINSILYINEIGSIPDKKSLKEEIKSELYSDMYDEDSLKIKVKEAINGLDVMNKISEYILKRYTEDTILYFYDPNDECYNYLENMLYETDGRIYISKYEDLIDNYGEEGYNDIYTIMKINNMKVENLIKENKLSMIYFLHGLIERLLSK